MRLQWISRLAAVSLVVLASGFLTAFTQPVTLDARWERSFPAGFSLVNVNTPSGNIAVEAWDRPEIGVRATLRASGASVAEAQHLLDSIRIEFGTDGSILRGDVPEPRPVPGGVGVDFTVRVPRDLAVDVRTGRGTIAVTGVAAPLSVTSGDGNLSVANAPGPMTLETSNGSVAVTLPPGAGAQLDLTTANGQISVQGVAAGLNRVQTGIGAGGPGITVRTSSGSIAVN